MMKNGSVFTVDFNRPYRLIIRFAIAEQTRSRESIAGSRGDTLHIGETAKVTIETKDDRVQEQSLVTKRIDNIDVRIICTRSANRVAFCKAII